MQSVDDKPLSRFLSGKTGKLLVPFFTGGFPNPEMFLDLLRRAELAGADAIEIGVPFSDPIADGPTIQETSQKALDQGVTLSGLLDLLTENPGKVPRILMSYLNPILSLGMESFCKRAEAAGVQGVILPDVCFEEASVLDGLLESKLAWIQLLAPTSTLERIATIASASQGFVYLVSLAGVTGARSDLPSGLEEFISRVRPHTQLPLLVGFGVSTGEHARRIGEFADGVVVGSALARPLLAGQGAESASALLEELRKALDESVSKPVAGETR